MDRLRHLGTIQTGATNPLATRRRDKLPTIWDRPAHTKAKHDILVKYLQAWFAIMGHSPYDPKVGVIDGFAGPGRYASGEPGSPVLVLETLLDHQYFPRWADTEFIFLFNEQDPPRYQSLRAVIDGVVEERQPWPPNVTVHAANTAFSELVTENLLPEPGKGLVPIFAFIDPFGYGDVPIDLISKLLAYDKAELFIYFDMNSVNRFAGKGAGVDHLFEALFGCDDFFQAPASGPDRATFLHDLYEKQLKDRCSMAYVRSFAMVNDRGRVGNYLIFCTRNLQAFDRMKYAMWQLAPAGDYRFEDRLAGQTILFDESHDMSPLQDALASRFAGQTVNISDIVDYVIAETPYHKGQVKVKTLKPMQSAGRISTNQKRSGVYPLGTLVTFA